MSTTTIYAGEVSSGLVADYSNTIIVSGGTVTDTTIDYGAMSVFIAGAQVSNTVMSGGILYASAGQIENTTMDDGAVFSALYSVDITGTTINSGGTASFRASSVKDTIVNSGGRIDIYGGTVTNTTVNQGSMSLANSNAAAYNTFITGSGYYTTVQVGNSATITGTTVESSAYLRLSYGAVANDTILNRGGNLIVSSAATAANTTVNEGGSMSIEGGTADLVTVNSGGWLSAGYSWNGATDTASATRVTENGGAVYVGSGSSYEYDYELGSYTYQYFTYPVEFASNTFSGLVYSGYRGGTVHSGTTAVDITAIVGGLTVYSGGKVSGYNVTPYTHEAVQTSWIYSSSYNEETSSWDYTSSPVVSNVEVTELGGLTVSSGGIVTGLVAEALPGFEDNGTYLNFQIARDTEITGTIDGTAFEMKNGALSNVSLKNAGLTYMSGANVSGVTQINGSASFLSASYARDLNFSGGKATFSSGAAADGVKTFVVPYTYTSYGMGDGESSEETLVETSSGASVSVLFGATVTNLDMDSESYLHMQVAPFTVLQGSSGGQTIDLKNGYFGNASLGNTIVEVLGTTTGTDGNGNAVQIAGGTVSDLIILNGATVTVMEGGEAWNMVENGGALHLSDDWMEEPLGLYSIVSNTFSYGHLEGDVTVHKNTVALDNIMYGGNLQVFSGGVVSNFYTVAGGGKMNMYSIVLNEGAIVTNLDMDRYTQLPYHPGNIDIYGGVYLADARLTDYDGISLTVTPDTVFTNCSIDNVPFSVEGGVLSGFYANGDGWFSDSVTVTDGGRMVDCYINSYGEINLKDGASARNLTIANNYMYVGSGCRAENVTVGLPAVEIEEDGYSYTDYNSATAYVSGTLRDFTINEYSVVEVYNGGTVTGVMRIGDGKLNVYDGGTVDFDVTDPSAQSVARLDDLRGLYATSPSSYPFSGGVQYTITVDSTNQAAGNYVLANHAYIGTNEYLYLNVVDTNGENYGYFEGYYTTVWQPDESYEIEFMSYFAGNAPSGFSYGLSAKRVEREDGVIDFDLVFTVDSEIAPTAWFAAPTVTADIATFTNQDVFLTVAFDEETTLREFSTDCTVWQAFEGDGISVSANDTYFFRGTDANGTVSDVTSFRVSNIDFVAPTVAADLASAVDESTVTLSWTDSTDDYAGVKGFNVSYWLDGKLGVRTVFTPGTELVLEEMVTGTWNWTVTALDYAGNASSAVQGADFVVSGGTVTPPPTPTYVAKSDIDGNGISDAMFVWTGTTEQPGNYQHGYWMNGTSEWQSANTGHPANWDNLGNYDMTGDGKADSVMFGNVDAYEVPSAYIGFYQDGIDTDENWVTIGFLSNAAGIAWQNKVGNMTGNASGVNSIAWYAPELGSVGVWTDGTDNWVQLNGAFMEGWTMAGMGDFDGDGKDSVVMSYNGGQFLYTVGIGDEAPTSLGSANWSGWELRAIGDFSGDGKDDIVLFHGEYGAMVMLADGSLDNYTSIGQLDKNDWFVVGAGDYDGDKQDDLLVRQYSSGMLGYYSSGDMAQWNVLGYGVDMNWTVIA